MNDNEAIARYVMGWEKRKNWGQALDIWADKVGEWQCGTDDWRPDLNLSQALMVAEAMRRKEWDVTIELRTKTFPNEYSNYCLAVNAPLYLYGSAANLESAIHAAAVQVARAMEAKDAK